MEQLNTSVYAGTCTSCYCAYDAMGRRTVCLTEADALALKSNGICGTCKTVKVAVARNNKKKGDVI